MRKKSSARRDSDSARQDGNASPAARSRHTNGVNSAFCDGSVHYLTNSIDPTTYLNLGNMNDGQVLGSY